MGIRDSLQAVSKQKRVCKRGDKFYVLLLAEINQFLYFCVLNNLTKLLKDIR